MSDKECDTKPRADLNQVVPQDFHAGIFYLNDGGVIVLDSSGQEIKPQCEKDIFPIEKVVQIEKIESTTTITIRGSHYKVKKIGDEYYKIPIRH